MTWQELHAAEDLAKNQIQVPGDEGGFYISAFWADEMSDTVEKLLKYVDQLEHRLESLEK